MTQNIGYNQRSENRKISSLMKDVYLFFTLVDFKSTGKAIMPKECFALANSHKIKVQESSDLNNIQDWVYNTV